MISNLQKTWLKNFHKRDKYIQTFAWAIPDDNTISKICEFAGEDTILEIGAGLGYWAKLLQDEGAKIIPTDNKEGYWKHSSSPPHTNVIRIKHINAVRKFTEAKVLFLCWPPYDTPMAYKSLIAFKGNKLIYIGERSDGCNATKDFFDLLGEQWELHEHIKIPQWYGIHDSMFLYNRKDGGNENESNA